MRVSWMERNTNVWVLDNIKPEWTLESRVMHAALMQFDRNGEWRMMGCLGE